MHSWQVGSQVMIQFLKVRQTDDPKRVIHCVHQAPTNKRNDPGNERLFQHLSDHWVWESTGVPILRLHQTQNKHTNKSRHAMFVEGAPRFFPPFIHPPRVAVQRCQLGSHSTCQALFSVNVGITAQAAQWPSRCGHSRTNKQKSTKHELKARSDVLGPRSTYIP